MRRVWVFDLDGTLADCSHRLLHIQKEPKDWRAFFADCHRDVPIDHAGRLCRALEKDAGVVFVSARSDECREATENWIERRIAIRAPKVWMRRAGDYRDDSLIKIELLADMRAEGFEPIMVFDDRDRAVGAWRAAGVPCAQVAPGDF